MLALPNGEACRKSLVMAGLRANRELAKAVRDDKSDQVHLRMQKLGQSYLSRNDNYENREGLIAEICSRIMAGEPMAQVCRDERMPPPHIIGSWCETDNSIAIRIARAKDIGADAIAMDALDIADDVTGDVQRDKLRFDARMRLLAKWAPKKYGDNVQMRLADADGEKLETGALVGELLTMMGGSQAPAAPVLLNVTPTRVEGRQTAKPAREPATSPKANPPAYRPRQAAKPKPAPPKKRGPKPKAQRVDDLV